MDYVMFCVDNLFSFMVEIVKGMLCMYNLFGVKGCGEVGVIGLLLVLINVIVDVFVLLGVKDI